jgi:aminobenzoyl-glutamate utilization protein B
VKVLVHLRDLKTINMNLKTTLTQVFIVCFLLLQSTLLAQRNFDDAQIELMKARVSEIVNANKKLSQVMVDKIFSFSELGFHEKESSNYLTGILEKMDLKLREDSPEFLLPG